MVKDQKLHFSDLDYSSNAGRGFHWSKTDTIITICVCLGFGMLAKTACLVVYLRHRYLKVARKNAQYMQSDADKPSPSGTGPLIGKLRFPKTLTPDAFRNP